LTEPNPRPKKDGKKNALEKIPASAVATKLFGLVKDGKIATREEFNKMCILLNKRPTTVIDNINQTLIDTNSKERFSHLFNRDGSLKNPTSDDKMPQEEEIEEAPVPAIPQGF
jgi:hypothetical protein